MVTTTRNLFSVYIFREVIAREPENTWRLNELKGWLSFSMSKIYPNFLTQNQPANEGVSDCPHLVREGAHVPKMLLAGCWMAFQVPRQVGLVWRLKAWATRAPAPPCLLTTHSQESTRLLQQAARSLHKFIRVTWLGTWQVSGVSGDKAQQQHGNPFTISRWF